MQVTEKVELDAGDQKYDKSAGYSEDYGYKETSFQPAVEQPEEPYYSGGGGNGNEAAAATAGDGGAPVNPFTQRQYQTNSTNPFAK